MWDPIEPSHRATWRRSLAAPLSCRPALALALAALVAISGCDDAADLGTLAPDTPQADGADGAMADVGDSATPDTVGPDTHDADTAGPTPPWQPPPVRIVSEPEPLTLAEGGDPELGVQWRTVRVGNKPVDPIAQAVADGTLTFPEPGAIDGLFWQDEAPGDGGAFKGPSQGLPMWILAKLPTGDGAPLGVLVRPDRIVAAHHVRTGHRQPGDPYGHGKHRVPLRVDTEDRGDLLAFHVIGGGGDPSLGLWRTDDEVHFNMADRTLPDLVAGSAAPTWLGVHVQTLVDRPVTDVLAMVAESEHFEATTTVVDGIASMGSTQVPFELVPKAPFDAPDVEVTVTLKLAAPALAWTYETTVTLTTVSSDPAVSKRERVAFRSPVDASVQYYALLRPTVAEGEDAPDGTADPGPGRGLVLSLHGAGVQATGQADSYAGKPDTLLVAPTNRRRFGFDWEVWGRLNGLAALAHAMDTQDVDPTRVYVTGHSMGGHGTWQFGHLYPGRFALVGPSAGWISFETYGGPAFGTGPFYWARRSSDTLRYKTNLAKRAVYIVHGDADDNVPISQALTMVEELEPVVPDLQWHWQPGAGHWWNVDPAPGADCVDWAPMFETMADRRLDPTELDFTFTSPSPDISARHSFVSLRSASSPASDLSVASVRSGDGGTVTLTTTNVRGYELDGAALLAAGVTTVVADGAELAVTDGPIPVGPQAGKRPGQYGPYTHVFYAPFCYVVPDEAPWGPGSGLEPGPAEASPRHETYARRYADSLSSTFGIIGNGHSCVVPLSRVDETLRATRNLVYVGLPMSAVPLPDGFPLAWDARTVTVGPRTFSGVALAAAFPDGDRLAGVVVATAGAEPLWFRLSPFSSRFLVPDYLVWADEGVAATGFFDADWQYAASLSVP